MGAAGLLRPATVLGQVVIAAGVIELQSRGGAQQQRTGIQSLVAGAAREAENLLNDRETISGRGWPPDCVVQRKQAVRERGGVIELPGQVDSVLGEGPRLRGMASFP